MGLLILVAFLSLLALGTWQLQRRVWKLQLIHAVATRQHGSASPAPGPAAWPSITAQRDAYRRVSVSGVFENGKETLVLALTDLGSGFWVMTPMRTSSGFTVLINRGFVADDERAAQSRPSGQLQGSTTVTGLLRVSEPGGGFLRHNDPSGDRWYSRDVAAIGRARGLSTLAPYFIDADSRANPGGWPVGGLTVVNFPNNHLVYALTWYGMAALLAWASVNLIWKNRRGLTDEKDQTPHGRAESASKHAPSSAS
jgi:surfeit locus 1 family protein